jgi:hypothetical protein
MVSPTEVAASEEPLSDEEVVARVLAGETGMFEIVMRRHNQRLYRVARLFCVMMAKLRTSCRTPTCARTNI